MPGRCVVDSTSLALNSETYFTVISDQALLRWSLKISEPQSRLMRWCMRLNEVDFYVRYKKDPFNTQADALSRLPLLKKAIGPVDADILTHPLCPNATPNRKDGKHDVNEDLALTTDTSFVTRSITLDETRLLQDDDELYRTKRARFCVEERFSFVFNNASVMFRSIDGFEQVAIPQFLVPRVLCLAHPSGIAGHLN